MGYLKCIIGQGIFVNPFLIRLHVLDKHAMRLDFNVSVWDRDYQHL